MIIRHTLPRHALQLESIQKLCEEKSMAGMKYIVVCLDGPDSFDRGASWASDFNDVDTKKLFWQLYEQLIVTPAN